MKLFTRVLFGALMIVIIQALSQTDTYYVAGLVPLFPTFTLISHYIVGSERSVADLRATIIFGLFALAPYVAYMIALYFLVERVKLVPALLLATLVWGLAALLLVLLWGWR
jgi:uncharacterized membrane protein (GlpM family)